MSDDKFPFEKLNKEVKENNERSKLSEMALPKPKLTEEELAYHRELADNFNKWVKEMNIHSGPGDDVSRSDMEDNGYWSKE